MKTSNKLMVGLTVASVVGKIIDKSIIAGNIKKNTQTTFNLHKDSPVIDSSTYVHPFASIIGQVNIGKDVFIGPFSSIRGDEGLRIHISDKCNVQDGVVLHGLKNFEYTSVLFENSVYHNGNPYSIYISDRVSLAHQCQIHGPAKIGKDVFVGMQSLVFDSLVNEKVVIEPGAKVIGVTIPAGRYVSAGKVITTQEEADNLPTITPEYKYAKFNNKVVNVNTELAKGYKDDQ
ncbi:gamma carbonic anhydrase family protein [Litchfieldia salsa]|uniref:Carbonic anhydrase or acetyltransferase, isoleucine patch superfamily n=1 Tax=Litchfieldia salsa TaxID=930152 RepID=A0A1H0RQX5_9BACI|nr:carbonic anhydrase [Litchfieldia salsa]SDP31398.1 Carbonic anhydrase or acetyltransferase, isoleucine patch superfamily [Litchfieldia salsa]